MDLHGCGLDGGQFFGNPIITITSSKVFSIILNLHSFLWACLIRRLVYKYAQALLPGNQLPILQMENDGKGELLPHFDRFPTDAKNEFREQIWVVACAPTVWQQCSNVNLPLLVTFFPGSQCTSWNRWTCCLEYLLWAKLSCFFLFFFFNLII